MLANASSTEARTKRALVLLNVAGAMASAAFAARGMMRPEYVQPTQTASPLSSFWASSSAVRSWAITGPLVASLVVTRRAPQQLFLVAGLAQLGDSALGIWQRKPDMAIAPASMGLVHLASSRLLAP